MKKQLGWFLFISLNCLSLDYLEGATRIVTNSADSGAVDSLRNIINSSFSGDTIVFSPSISGSTINLTPANGPLVITTNITIDGGTNNITVSGQDLIRPFFVQSGITGTIAISNLTLTHGAALGGAGGNQTTVTGGGAGGGGGGLGGALFADSNVTLTNVLFISNTAVGGVGGSLSGIGSATGGAGGGGMGGAGGSQAPGDGGGAGGGGMLVSQAGSSGGGTTGGAGGGSGGDGGSQNGAGLSGSRYGGGGGGGESNMGAARGGGTGGYGGGGGGEGDSSITPSGFGAGQGGVGGGGGGTSENSNAAKAASAFGGGHGGGNPAINSGMPGGGGAGLGGALFVSNLSTTTLTFTTGTAATSVFSGNSVVGGTAGTTTVPLTGGSEATAGKGLGIDIFMDAGSTLAFDIATGLTVTLTNAIQSNTSSATQSILQKTGAGTLNLSGVSHGFKSNIQMLAGTVLINSNVNLGGSGTTLTFNGGALEITGGMTLARAATISSGGGTLRVDSGTTAWSGALGGTGVLTKTGSGTLTLSGGTNSYSGGTVVSAGTLSISSAGNIGGATAGFTLSGGTLLATGFVTTSGAVSITDNSTLSASPASSSVVLSGTLTGSNNKTLTLTGVGTKSFSRVAVNGTDSFTIAGAISGSQILTKSGAGTLILSGTNTYTAGTLLAAGTIQISSDSNLGGSSGPLTFNGGVLEIVSGTFSSSRATTLSSAGGTVLVDSGASWTLSGVVGGAGALTKTGAGTLILSNVSNSYTGSTSIAGGMMSLTGTGSIADSASVAIASGATFDISLASTDVILSNVSGAGTIALGANNLTVEQTTPETFSGNISGSGHFNMNGTSSLILSGISSYTGVTSLGGGILTLAGSGSIAASTGVSLAELAILNVSGTTSGAILNNLSGAGTVVLGAESLTVITGTPTTFSGEIEGSGGLITRGSSIFTLTGANLYTGATSISEGTLALSGSGSISESSSVMVDAMLDISGTSSGTALNNLSGMGTIVLGSQTIHVVSLSDTTFFGLLEGAGGVEKTGTFTFTLAGENTYTGNTLVEDGTLLVTGSIASDVVISGGAKMGGSGTVRGSITVNSLGTLTHGSTFTIVGDVDNFGLMDLGDSISEIIIGGDLTFEPGSELDIFVSNAGNSLVTVGGATTIDPEASLELLADSSYNLLNHEFVLLSANSVTGKFSTVTSNSILVSSTVSYIGGDVIANYILVDIANLVTEANALSVGKALTKILDSGNPAFEGLFTSLLPLDAKELTDALNVMQPALFKGLAISQENNVVKVQDSLGFRLQQGLDEVHCFSVKKDADQKSIPCQKEKSFLHIWVDGFGDVLRQKSNFYAASSQTGYQAKTSGVVAGLDLNFGKYFYVGALEGYTGSSIDWRKDQGSGDIYTGYGGLYFSFLSDMYYANASIIGGFSHYYAKRNIMYPGVHEVARNSHGGSQLLSHLDTGVNFGIAGVSIRPFDSFDYISQGEGGFEETGAGVYNLKVKKTNAIMLRNELGLQLASCFCVSKSKWTLSPKISWIREVRVKGSSYTAKFAGTDVPFAVTGYFQNRNLISPGVMLTGMMWKDRLTMSLYYNGEFAEQYSDHNYGGQIRFGF